MGGKGREGKGMDAAGGEGDKRRELLLLVVVKVVKMEGTKGGSGGGERWRKERVVVVRKECWTSLQRLRSPRTSMRTPQSQPRPHTQQVCMHTLPSTNPMPIKESDN
ncbi:hypothetical protein Pcinc_030979 [Petrolisthes cinctipes]|uniref:Uncharacterized protein n=1 Tax=Petrolisthes cinctipes TaxID=88211 RepID=A0AAE1K1U4_PETCI|nr:hypothetical protein Pcinc_030979 [Petrolisthes cinctipes]